MHAEVIPGLGISVSSLPELLFDRSRSNGLRVSPAQIDTNAARIHGYIYILFPLTLVIQLLLMAQIPHDCQEAF